MHQQRGYDHYSGYPAPLQSNRPYRPQQIRGLSNNPVVLDDYNSDLNFLIEGDGFTGSTLYKNGFEYLWGGARATYGVSSGKACFEVVIRENLPVNMPDSEQNPHVARVGWSTDSSNLNVGEDRLSYGYGGTGKSSWNYKFYDYGEPYTVNDVITCYIDFDDKSIFFAKNGLYLGKAFELPQEANGIAFYPHITIKNMKVEVNFGYYPSRIPPTNGFTMIEHVPKNMLIRGTRGPDTRRQSQVIMMVGLPGSGKTVWANKYRRDHNEMKINILGTNAIMDRMKVTGLTRQRNYHGRWDHLIKQATNVLNLIFKIAEKKNRNYIIDQTNVYPGARRKKMASFHGFHRIAAVVVNTNDVLKQRTEKREREEGKIVPDKAVMEMKKNFTLPEVGESFDNVWFIEEDHQNSARLVEQFREEGKIFIEHEAEREREEMKRKREDQLTTEEPPAKEPFHSSTENRHQQYPPGAYEARPYHSRSENTHEALRYQPGHHRSLESPGYSGRGHTCRMYEPFHPQEPSRDYGSYYSPTQLYPLSGHESFNRQYSPGGQGSHDPYGRPPHSQHFYQHFYQQRSHFYPYNNIPSGYGCNPNLPVQEECLGGGCSQYDSLTNPRRGHAQENEYRGHNSQSSRNSSNHYNAGNRY